MTPVSSQTHALSINPATGEQIAHYPYESAEALDAALARAAAAAAQWRRTGLEQRSALLLALAKALRDNGEPLARSITLEMGKPIAQARGEIEKCAQLCEWYAAEGRRCSPPSRPRCRAARRASSTGRWARSLR